MPGIDPSLNLLQAWIFGVRNSFGYGVLAALVVRIAFNFSRASKGMSIRPTGTYVNMTMRCSVTGTEIRARVARASRRCATSWRVGAGAGADGGVGVGGGGVGAGRVLTAVPREPVGGGG